MKKTVVELFFGDKREVASVSGETPRFVYWHCSTLPPFKFERLVEKVKLNLSRIFVAGLSYVLMDFFGNIKFKLISKINDNEPQLWTCELAKESFGKMIKRTKKIQSKKNISASFMMQFPFKLEIKIIKYRVIFGLHYPENFHSTIVSNKILQSLDKYYRNLFKTLEI